MKNSCTFTICNIKYLPQAIVSIKSYSKVNSTGHLGIILVDSENDFEIDNISVLSLSTIIKLSIVENIYHDFEILKHYTVTSLCTAIKPLIFIYYKLTKSQCDSFVYIDPDTLWLTKSNFAFAQTKLIFFRHRDKLYKTDGYNGRNFLTFGGLNLGLIIDTGVDIQILKEWLTFALPINFESSMLGYYTDQKPADLLVLSGRGISYYDKCINLSYWNIADIELQILNDGHYQATQDNCSANLSMFHFSGYRKSINDYSSERGIQYLTHKNSNVIKQLHIEYTALLEVEINKTHTLCIVQNEYGSAKESDIFKYLLLNRLSNNKLIFIRLIAPLLVKSKLLIYLVARLYRFKNPLKI